ncbi:MAG TPA: PA0069 family radical SAM protein [Gemmataceae bacterium]|nr:PA0069 family radical SAM protein [Gemmataceae bacterium]
MQEKLDLVHGRGAGHNPANRFERVFYETDPEDVEPESPAPTTQFYKDTSRTIIVTNDSPDVGFDASINPYRGCEHGCIYCYARPTHEYLGFSSGLDFESRIMVKEEAPELLRQELSSRKWQPQVLSLSGVTDPYQPVERRLKLTRRCLEVLAEFRNPVTIVTKSRLVTRDADLLGELARHDAAAVFLSVTSLDGNLSRVLEPRAAQPSGRLNALEELARAGVPTGVMVAPVIPGLTDHELPAIINAAASAGARFAGYITIRLPFGVAPLFERWLEQHFPEKKDKVLSRIREIRGGKLNDPRFGSRMKGEGTLATAIHDLYTLACRKAGIGGERLQLSTAFFRRPGNQQGLLFD